MTSDNSWFNTAVAKLTDPQQQRVWSLIISLFGDLAQDKGARISGGALTRIIEPMGIKPEAIRVALHRLRKDGWIESARSGRVSMHYLTEYGRTQSARVTPRIYARTPALSQKWHLLIAEDGPGIHTLDDLMMTRDYTQIGRSVALGEGAPPRHCDGLLVFDVALHSAPAWLQARLCPQILAQACSTLRDAVRSVRESRLTDQQLSPLEIATLRTLVIHRWRRVVLRHPNLPPEFFPENWSGQTCRTEVFDLLDLLPRPTPNELNMSA